MRGEEVVAHQDQPAGVVHRRQKPALIESAASARTGR